MGIINADELAKSYKLSLLKKIKAGDLHDDDLFQISSIRTNPKYFDTKAIDLDEFTKYIALKIGEHTGVEVTPYHDSGDKIATIAINGVPVDIYANDIEDVIDKNVSGSIVSFDDAAEAPLVKCLVDITAQQAGSGDPSPENVRPISGFSEVDVTRAGKNLWSFGNISGTKQFNVDVNIPIGLWTFSCEIISSDVESDTSLVVFQYDNSNSTYIRLQRGSRVSYSLTTTKVVKKISFYAGYNSTQSADDTFTYSNIQLEIGNTATAYKPYNGNTYNIDWEDEAGTVYGGTIDVLKGKLTVTHKAVDLGTLEWYISGASGTTGAQVYSTSITDRAFNASVIGMCSNYKWYGNAVLADLIANLDNNSFGYYINSVSVMIRDDSFIGKTRTEIKTALSGVQLVYELATPIEYDLTPQQISTLLGTNNIFANSGDVDVTYFLKGSQPIIDLIDKKSSLPVVTAADAGKVLMVDANGQWVAANLPSEG